MSSIAEPIVKDARCSADMLRLSAAELIRKFPHRSVYVGTGV